MPDMPCGSVWVVFDGPVDGIIADRLSRLMLGQMIWDNTGARIRCQGHHRVLWETTDLSDSSPALLASAGICGLHETIISASAAMAGAMDTVLAKCPMLDQVRPTTVAARKQSAAYTLSLDWVA